MGIDRRRALRSHPPAGQRITVRLFPAGGGERVAHLFDLSEVGLAALFTREAAQEFALGSTGQIKALIAGPEGVELRLECPVILRQIRPMASGFLVGLELELEAPQHQDQRQALGQVVEHWLRLAHGKGGPGANQAA
jgi:hypothetical protein